MRWARFILVVFVLGLMGTLSNGCRVDAIETSNRQLNFERNPYPITILVWNANPDKSDIIISLEASEPWIRIAPETVRSKAPQGGVRDEQEVVVEIDRSRISSLGLNKGKITLRAPRVKPVKIDVSVFQESVAPEGGLRIINPAEVYSKPYLVEFAFALRDSQGRAVVGEPSQFDVIAYEDGAEVGVERGLRMRRGAARQLWLELVLDYSIVMQDIDGAISKMEYAATRVLLDSLNADALVGVSEFHRDDQPSNLVVPFNVDRAYTTSRINAIQTEYVRGFASGARMYDALMAAIRRFSQGSVGPADEKYVVLFSNGRDTSSSTWGEQVALEATRRGVRIIAVGFGDAVDSAALMALTSITGGRYIPADSVDALEAAFRRIVEDLEGQYIVRWASLRRDNRLTTPSITIRRGLESDTYKASRRFRATDHAGDALAGRLVMVQSDAPTRTTLFLRANYVPRGIKRFSFYVESAHDFSVSKVRQVDDGLVDNWSLARTEEGTGYRITVQGNLAIPFAEFGPLLRFDFSQSIDEAFVRFDIDNAVYTEGQTFALE